MSRATLGGSKIATRPTTSVPGGQAGGPQARTDQLMGRQRPAWADDPTLTLPCQQPGVDPDWWFEAGSGPGAKVRRATAQLLCRGCEMRVECRAAAEANHEGWGVWGGIMMERVER
jgi:hypothetical protein